MSDVCFLRWRQQKPNGCYKTGNMVNQMQIISTMKDNMKNPALFMNIHHEIVFNCSSKHLGIIEIYISILFRDESKAVVHKLPSPTYVYVYLRAAICQKFIMKIAIVNDGFDSFIRLRWMLHMQCRSGDTHQLMISQTSFNNSSAFAQAASGRWHHNGSSHGSILLNENRQSTVKSLIQAHQIPPLKRFSYWPANPLKPDAKSRMQM